MYMCCRAHVLCTNWFAISPKYSCGEPNPVHQPINIISLEAQDPCYHLGLGIVQNRNPQVVKLPLQMMAQFQSWFDLPSRRWSDRPN